MLNAAQRKSWPDGVRFVHGNAQNLAAVGVTGPFDGILAAYLVRNLPSPDAALRSFLTMLRPGAPLAVHDYSVRDSVRSRVTWTAVCWTIIIPMGRLRTGSSGLYRYLWRSVLRFDGVKTLAQRLRDAGFVDVRCQTFSGWQQNIVHTVLGRRRPEPETAPAPSVADVETPPLGLPR
jgi:ubiquinone/menaquinone biosynthesis C-methylase UbiE